MPKRSLRIGFLGTPDFAASCLAHLLDSSHQVVGVVTAPDRPAGRGHRLRASAVKNLAVAHNLPVLQPDKLRDPQFLAQWDAWQVDVGVVVAFRMMPELLWSRPPLGTINLHASLLPQLRGAAPIQRAIMAGLKETGVTTFRLKAQIDTGDLLGQSAVPIGPDTHAGMLHDALLEAGKALLIETLDGLANGDIVPIPQEALLQENKPLLEAPKLFKNDTIVDWAQPSFKVHNHIRGLHPFPGAWSNIRFADGSASALKLHVARRVTWPGESDAAPGMAMAGEQGDLVVKCEDGACAIESLTPAGKKAMSGGAWLRGLATELLPLRLG